MDQAIDHRVGLHAASEAAMSLDRCVLRAWDGGLRRAPLLEQLEQEGGVDIVHALGEPLVQDQDLVVRGKSWLACALGVAARNVLLGALHAHVGDARRARRIQGRGVSQIEEALHEVRCADSGRLAVGEDRGRPGPRAA